MQLCFELQSANIESTGAASRADDVRQESRLHPRIFLVPTVISRVMTSFCGTGDAEAGV